MLISVSICLAFLGKCTRVEESGGQVKTCVCSELRGEGPELNNSRSRSACLSTQTTAGFCPPSPQQPGRSQSECSGDKGGREEFKTTEVCSCRKLKGLGKAWGTSRGRWLAAQGPVGSFRSWPALAPGHNQFSKGLCCNDRGEAGAQS